MTNEQEEVLEHVSTEFGVDKDALWGMYLEVMRSNFEQDLWDIAKENEEELKELSEVE